MQHSLGLTEVSRTTDSGCKIIQSGRGRTVYLFMRN